MSERDYENVNILSTIYLPITYMYQLKTALPFKYLKGIVLSQREPRNIWKLPGFILLYLIFYQ